MECGNCIHLDMYEASFVCSKTMTFLDWHPRELLPIQNAACILEGYKTEVDLSVGDTTPNFGPKPDDWRR